MTDNLSAKIIMILIYIIIILFIPLFLDYLFKLTVRKKRKNQIKFLANEKVNQTGKPLVVFNDRYHGTVINTSNSEFFNDTAADLKENFTGDISEIVDKMADNSCVIIVSQTLEYVDDPAKLIEQIRRISGGDMYLVNVEKNSPRIWWDYNVKNIMENPFYLPSDKEIIWKEPNDPQRKTQKFYSHIFKVVPYQFFVNDPIEK